jgi:hypothetical protein
MRNIALIRVFQAIVHEEGGAIALLENTNKVWRYVRSTKSRICRIIRGKSGGCCPASSPQSFVLAGRVGSQILVRASYWGNSCFSSKAYKAQLVRWLAEWPENNTRLPAAYYLTAPISTWLLWSGLWVFFDWGLRKPSTCEADDLHTVVQLPLANHAGRPNN